MPRPQRKVTIREVKEMQRLYEQEGRSIKQIAESLDRSQGLVHRYLRAQGVEIRPSHVVRWPGNLLSHDEMRRTAELYLSGLTAREVGEVVGRDTRTVLYRLERAGVPRRDHSDAIKGKARRTEHESAIIALYEAGASQTETARKIGVRRQTVRNVLDRRGIEVRSRSDGVRRSIEMRSRGEFLPPRPPSNMATTTTTTTRRVRPAVRHVVDAERLARIPAQPLRRVLGDVEPEIANIGLPGISARLLWAWGKSGSRTDVDRADRVLLRLDRLWWEVFDPAVAPGLFSGARARDVVAWTEAAMRASEVWGDG